MIERKLSKLGGEVTRASIFLTRNLGSSITLERSLEKKSLDLRFYRLKKSVVSYVWLLKPLSALLQNIMM